MNSELKVQKKITKYHQKSLIIVDEGEMDVQNL